MKLVRYIGKNSLLKLYNNKTAFFAIMIAVTCWSYNRPMYRLCQEVDYPVSWCVFPFFMSSYPFLILFLFGVIYVNSDVPFMQHIHMYQTIRTGRIFWGLGQIGGIVIRSLTLVCFTAVCTIATLFPRIEFSNEWGKVLRTVAMTDIMRGYGEKYTIYYEIFNRYSPLQLMGVSILLCTLLCSFIGIFMFAVSLWWNRIAAVALAGAMEILLFFVLNSHPAVRSTVALFVPVIWAEVAQIATPLMGWYWLPSVSYMLGVLCGLLVVLSLLILVKVRTTEFPWESEDS